MNGTLERELKLKASARFSPARTDPQLEGLVASPVRFRAGREARTTWREAWRAVRRAHGRVRREA